MKEGIISMEDFKDVPNKPDLIKMRESLNNMRDMSDLLKESWRISAGIMKAKYDALVSEGFTSEQALDLCKSGPI